MANLAQEEVERLFSQHARLQAHPEDISDSDRDSVDEKEHSEPAFVEDPNQDTDDDEIADKIGALTTTRSTYILPATEQYANTGPKGVIADAQSFTRAKRDAYKKPITTITNFSYPEPKFQDRDQGSGSEEEEDHDFMAQWRANRLAELAANDGSDRHLRPHPPHQRRVSPSRRTYGRAVRVDALGYLDAIEKVSADTTVLVMIYDSESAESLEVEDEVDVLAYKHGHVRFVKLDQDIAEMEHIQVPALLAYKAGDVYATISGAQREGLERTLATQVKFRSTSANPSNTRGTIPPELYNTISI